MLSLDLGISMFREGQLEDDTVVKPDFGAVELDTREGKEDRVIPISCVGDPLNDLEILARN